jgi:UDP-N-acetylmuramoyl-tripeptide--D-alanyl-D-alanine ligase
LFNSLPRHFYSPTQQVLSHINSFGVSPAAPYNLGNHSLSEFALTQLTPKFVADSIKQWSIDIRPHDQDAKSNQKFVKVTTDSRQISPGCLFVGIKGEHFDGNAFAEQALQAGALGVVTAQPIDPKPWANRYIYHVSDSLAAFRDLARAWRKVFRGPVVAVAGSVGKTTTKEMTAALLRGKWPSVIKTESSQNGFVGIPMTLMSFTPDHHAAVVEIGIDDVDAMMQHWQLVLPDLAVITVTGPEHLERLRDVETASREEFVLLVQAFHAGKTVVLNLDDERIIHLARENKISGPNVWGFSLRQNSAQALSIPKQTIYGEYIANSNRLKCTASTGAVTLDCPLHGAHNANNLLAAFTVGRALGLTEEEMRSGLKLFHSPPGRSEVKNLPTGQTVICDHYNANPSSFGSALEMSQTIHRSRGPSKGKLWACLGDMLELGAHEERMHRNLAKVLADHQVDEVLLVGERMRWLLDEVNSRRINIQVRHVETHQTAAEVLARESRPQDTILIKGSRGLRMERVWEALAGSKKS